MTEMEEIRQVLREVNQKLDRLLALQEADLTITDFAKRAGYHPNTIHRWIKNRRILTRHGRVPASELKKFVSSW